jgi:hypothetical protein
MRTAREKSASESGWLRDAAEGTGSRVKNPRQK